MASTKKVVFITGGNTGIGYETVKALLQSSVPYHVFLGSRSLEKGNDAVAQLQKEVPDHKSEVEVIQIDISSDQSIEDAFEKVKAKSGHIDALINNAGMSVSPEPGKLTIREAWIQTYDINVASTEVVTNTFAPLLLKSSEPRLLFITSGLSSLSNLSGSWYAGGPQPSAKGWPKPGALPHTAYRSSKTALNMLMLNWHWMLKPDGVKVFSISPGFLATGLGGAPEVLKKMGARHPSIGGNIIKSVVEGERDADEGKVVGAHGPDGLQPF